MEYSDKVIILNYNRKYFEDIYFKNKQGSIILNPEIRHLFIISCLSLTLLLGSLTFSLLTNKGAWLIIILLIFTLASLFLYAYKASIILRWRKKVNEFIKQNEIFKAHKLVLTDQCFSLIQDEKETIQKWSAITHFEITASYLIITGTFQLLIPYQSMLPEEYTSLVQRVKSHIKNGL